MMSNIEDSTNISHDSNDTFMRFARLIVKDMNNMPQSSYDTPIAFTKTMMSITRKYKCTINKRWLSVAYREFHDANPVAYPINSPLRSALIKKAVRSASGIVNISVVMPPDRFSCKYNCKFCPNETIANGATVDMPRSYLSNEDAVRRAASVDFIATEQVRVRFRALEENGHPIDKIEFRILGGTFSCYPHDVADLFIRDLYYAANTYKILTPRTRLTLIEEIALNTSATIHVVGLGVETRPDEIDISEIIRFRNYGVTRVEIGVQHTNDAILRGVNRGHGLKQSKAAIKLLKDYGFKVEIHIMTDLPGSSPQEDMECYRKVLVDDPDLIPDYMKDYPCLDVSFTEIKRWKEEGIWKPYAEQDGGKQLRDVLIYRQTITPPWVRVNRIQRDFALAQDSNNYLGFTSDTLKTNLGDLVTREAESRGIFCQCIRCREIRHDTFNPAEIVYRTHTFNASGAQEYFICAEVSRPHRNLLLGFIRLRLLSSQESAIPELQGRMAMIRELHVYGQVKPVGERSSANSSSAQHIGIGRTLLKRAETIARRSAYTKIAVISGIGVRDYYRKYGYILNGTYMVKDIPQYISWIPLINMASFIAILMIIIIIKHTI